MEPHLFGRIFVYFLAHKWEVESSCLFENNANMFPLELVSTTETTFFASKLNKRETVRDYRTLRPRNDTRRDPCSTYWAKTFSSVS